MSSHDMILIWNFEKVVTVPSTFEELINIATERCGFHVKRVFTAKGGEIRDTEVIR
jgi:hypothetical protein